jgi:hypothetical protein
VCTRGVSLSALERSNISIILATVAVFGSFGVYAYLNDKAQHEPFSADAYVAREMAMAREMAGGFADDC